MQSFSDLSTYLLRIMQAYGFHNEGGAKQIENEVTELLMKIKELRKKQLMLGNSKPMDLGRAARSYIRKHPWAIVTTLNNSGTGDGFNITTKNQPMQCNASTTYLYLTAPIFSYFMRYTVGGGVIAGFPNRDLLHLENYKHEELYCGTENKTTVEEMLHSNRIRFFSDARHPHCSELRSDGTFRGMCMGNNRFRDVVNHLDTESTVMLALNMGTAWLETITLNDTYGGSAGHFRMAIDSDAPRSFREEPLFDLYKSATYKSMVDAFRNLMKLMDAAAGGVIEGTRVLAESVCAVFTQLEITMGSLSNYAKSDASLLGNSLRSVVKLHEVQKNNGNLADTFNAAMPMSAETVIISCWRVIIPLHRLLSGNALLIPRTRGTKYGHLDSYIYQDWIFTGSNLEDRAFNSYRGSDIYFGYYGFNENNVFGNYENVLTYNNNI